MQHHSAQMGYCSKLLVGIFSFLFVIALSGWKVLVFSWLQWSSKSYHLKKAEAMAQEGAWTEKTKKIEMREVLDWFKPRELRPCCSQVWKLTTGKYKLEIQMGLQILRSMYIFIYCNVTDPNSISFRAFWIIKNCINTWTGNLSFPVICLIKSE